MEQLKKDTSVIESNNAFSTIEASSHQRFGDKYNSYNIAQHFIMSIYSDCDKSEMVLQPSNLSNLTDYPTNEIMEGKGIRIIIQV